MKLIQTPISGCYEISLKLFEDHRGRFARTFCHRVLAEYGVDFKVAQANWSQTTSKGSVRGLHYQNPPQAESKIVRALKGAIFDVCVDLRADSPTFGKWHGIELSSTNLKMLLLPKGCAHGFQSLEDDCEMLYFHDEYFDPAADRVASFQDPLFSIQWPLPVTMMSDKDKNASDFTPSFKGLKI